MREDLKRRAARLPLAVGATFLLLQGSDAIGRGQQAIAACCFTVGAIDLLAIVVLARAERRGAVPVLLLNAVTAGLVAWLDAPGVAERSLWLLLAAAFVAIAVWSARRHEPITKASSRSHRA